MIDHGAAVTAAVRLLANRRLTCAQLRQKLGDRGFSPASIEAAVAECERRGYLDDRAYAKLYVQSILDRKPVGRMRLLAELLRHGVEGNLAREILDGVGADEDERIDRALTKLEATRPQDRYEQLARRLERLGFTAPTIARALRRRADRQAGREASFQELE